MEFPEKYFESEIRDSFYIESMMKKAWAAQIEVLCEIDRVCKKYGIQYFAEWGTLLGTIRHKGFITWDDDMDICMKRPDYLRFLEVAPKELQYGCQLLNIHTDDEYDNMLSRVINGRKINFEEQHMKKYHNCPYVVGLDIFPLDFVAPSEAEDDLQCQLINLVMHAANAIIEKDTREDVSEDGINELVAQIESLCNITLDKNRNLANQLFILAEQLCMLYSDAEASKVALMVAYSDDRNKYIYPKEWYASSIDMPFENITIPVPVGYHEILQAKYGEDYMTPINCRGGHNYPFYKEQQRIAYRMLGYTPK